MYDEIFKRYITQITEELSIDQLNLSEVTMLVAGRKHFWNQKLTEHKMELINLERKKKEITKKLLKKIQEDSPVRLSSSTEMKSIENADLIKELNTKIEDLTQLIEFLERNFRTMSNLHLDVKNIIELIKAQTM